MEPVFSGNPHISSTIRKQHGPARIAGNPHACSVLAPLLPPRVDGTAVRRRDDTGRLLQTDGHADAGHRSRRRHAQAGTPVGRQRTARQDARLSDLRRAPASGRHRAAATVRGRRRREGRPGALRDRPRDLPRRLRQRAGLAGAGRGRRHLRAAAGTSGEELVGGGRKSGRVNLLSWDGKGIPEGLFPPDRKDG